MLPLLLAGLTLTAAQAQAPQAQDAWRLVHADGTVEAVAGPPRAEPEGAAPRRWTAAWTWGAGRAPRRLEPAQIGRAPLPEDSARLEVRVVRRAAGPVPEDLHLIAAPAEMWREVPEELLPSWPVPREGKVSIPVDPSRGWRVRLAGKTEGSWWTGVRPGQKTVSLTSTAPPAGLDIQIVGPDQRPVEGVRGLVQQSGGGELSLWATLQGEKGRLGAPGLPDEAALSLTLVKPGFSPLVLRGRPSAIPRRVRLVPAAELTGRLIDLQRRPVAGAEIEVEAFASADLPQTLTVQARSGADGTWRLGGVPAGKVAWTVRAPGFVPLVEMFEVEAGERKDLGARKLEPGSAVAFRVVDETGAPVPGARVTAARERREETADHQGRVTFEGVAAAPLEVTGSADRHMAGRAVFNPPFSAGLKLVLPRAFTVTGRLVDPSGAPVSRGSARLDSGVSQCESRLDPDGRFEIALPPGTRNAELLLRSPEVQELKVPVEAGAPGEVRDLGDLRASPGVAVTGRVVRASDGQPIPGARVWTTRPGPDGPAVAWATGDLLEGTTGADGRFRLAGLLPVSALLRVEAAGYARAQIEVAPVSQESDAGSAVEVGEIALSPGATVRVRVDTRDENGQELRGVTARVDLGNRWLEPDLLSAQVWDGEALFSNVPPGPVTVSAVAGRRLLCEQAVTVLEGGEQEVDCGRNAMTVSGAVQMGGAPVRSGTLVWQQPTEVPGRVETIVSPAGLRQYQIAGAGRPAVNAAVGPDGRFQTAELIPGRWQVLLVLDGTVTGSLTLDIPRVERFDTVLPFAGLSLAGVVTDRDDRPVEGARVRDLTGGGMAFTDAEGRFLLAGLKEGLVAVQARHGEQTSPVEQRELTPDRAPEPVLLVLGDHESPVVTVAVADESGAPVPGAFLFFEEEGKGVRLVTAAADGTAKVTLEAPLPPRVRAATFARGLWAFGGWVTRDTAREGLTLPLAGTGALKVTSARLHGSPGVVTGEGWNLGWLLRLLGAPPDLSPEQPLALAGLPEGQYQVSLESVSVTLAVKEGELAEQSLD